MRLAICHGYGTRKSVAVHRCDGDDRAYVKQHLRVPYEGGLSPAAEAWKGLPHHLLGLFHSEVLPLLPVDFPGEPRAVVDHLLHGHIPGENTIPVAVRTIIPVGSAVGVCAGNLVCEWHSAALT